MIDAVLNPMVGGTFQITQAQVSIIWAVVLPVARCAEAIVRANMAA